MARYPDFDEHQVIERAMNAFWAHGVKALTVTDLLERTGLARSSFYSSFGSKEAVLRASLRRYADERVEALRETLASGSLRHAMERIFAAAIDDNYRGRGCLLLNFAVEAGSAKSAAAPELRDGIRRMMVQLSARARQPQAEGELPATVAPEEFGVLVCTAIAGLRTFVKAGLSRAELRQAAARMIGLLTCNHTTVDNTAPSRSEASARRIARPRELPAKRSARGRGRNSERRVDSAV